MKKIIVVLSMLCIVNISFAQIRRNVPANNNANTDTVQKVSKKIMMDGLGLTKEQRAQMKQIQQSGKAQREVIMDNDSLSTEQKQIKLRELRKETIKDINAILTNEQRERMKEIKRQNHGTKTNDFDNSVQDSTKSSMPPEN